MSVLPFDVDVDGVGVAESVEVDVGDGEVAVEARVENFPELLDVVLRDTKQKWKKINTHVVKKTAYRWAGFN